MTEPERQLGNAKDAVQELADLLRLVGPEETIDEDEAERYADDVMSFIQQRNDAIAKRAMKGK